jgi:hypothetical protein
VPAQQGIWLHNVQCWLPKLCEPGQQDQTHPISLGELRSLHLSFEHDQLLSQDGILNDQIPAAAFQV